MIKIVTKILLPWNADRAECHSWIPIDMSR